MIKVENKIYYSINIRKELNVNDVIDAKIDKIPVYRTKTEIKKLIELLEKSEISKYQILELEVTGDVSKTTSSMKVDEYSVQGIAKVIGILDKKSL